MNVMAAVEALVDALLKAVAAEQSFFAEFNLSVELRDLDFLAANNYRLDDVVAVRVANWHAREESLDVGNSWKALSNELLVVRRVIWVRVAESLLSLDSTVLTTVAVVAAKTAKIQSALFLTERFLGDSDQVVKSVEELGSPDSASNASRSKLTHFCSLFLTKSLREC